MGRLFIAEAIHVCDMWTVWTVFSCDTYSSQQLDIVHTLSSRSMEEVKGASHTS